MVHNTADPGAFVGSLGEKQARRVGHGTQPGGRHLEHAKLADRPEPVLHSPHHAVRVMALAFEVEDGVHDMLQSLGPCEAAVLRDVPHEKRRNVLPFRGEQQLRRRLAHLADAAGRRLKLQREHRLHGVHDDKSRLDAGDFLENAFEAGFGKQVQRRVPNRQALASRLDLVLGLFA